MSGTSGNDGPERRPSTMSAAGARRTAMRVVQDADSVMLVYEFETGMMSEGVPTLVFERGASRRELTRFPVDWRRMSDVQLVSLLDTARDD